jgi:hypothetical protein
MAGLVTVVTRTLGRACIADAAASVAAQTHRPLEWVVVDATGRGIDVPPAGDVPIRVASAGEPLLRARAANHGLDAAEGARALILDDDDLLAPRALERLSAALDAQRDAHVAYGDVRGVSSDDREVAQFRFEFSELLVARRNPFPIHAAMVDLPFVRTAGVRFDESLDWYEDWQFWLALSARTRFVHVPETIATYRMHLSQSGIRDVDGERGDARILAQRDAVLARSAERRNALDARHDALKREARMREAAGRLPQAAAAWVAAHQDYHYDAEPLLRYAALALRAGDARAARASVDGGLALLPYEPALYRVLATILGRAGDRKGAADAVARAEALEAHGPVSPI